MADLDPASREPLPARPEAEEDAPRVERPEDTGTSRVDPRTAILRPLALYTAEIDPDPRRPGDRLAVAGQDDQHVLRLYRQTLRDERVSAALHQRLDAVLSRPWVVKPGGEMRRDHAAAKTLEKQLERIDFRTICRQLLHCAIWYGFAVAEVVWRPGAVRVEIDRVVVRAPDRFRFGDDLRLLLRSRGAPQGRPVPPAKFVLITRPGEHGDTAHGWGSARFCYWPVFLKRAALKFWSLGLQRYASPIAVGKYGPGASEAEKDALLDVVTGLASAAGITVPDDQAIDVLFSSWQTGVTYEQFVSYMDSSITTTLLGQSSTTDQGPWRGTAEVQKRIRDETIRGDARILDEALNLSVATWLTHWNHPGAAVPQIEHVVEEYESLMVRARREKIISETTGLRPTQEHVEEVYGGEWEPAPEPPPAPAPEPPPGPVDGPDADAGAEAGSEGDDPARMAAGTEPGADPDPISAAAKDAAADWRSLMEPLILPLLAAADGALERGEDLGTFRSALADLFNAGDESPVVEALSRRTFSAALSGELGLALHGPDDGAGSDGPA